MSARRPRPRALWALAGWGLVAAIVWLSLTPQPPRVEVLPSDKVHHLLAYFGLMFWFAQLHRRRLPLALACLALGAGLEVLQGLSGYRQASVLDQLANTAGVCLGWLAAWRLPNPLARLEATRP